MLPDMICMPPRVASLSVTEMQGTLCMGSVSRLLAVHVVSRFTYQV
jgi:hypothetical protein